MPSNLPDETVASVRPSPLPPTMYLGPTLLPLPLSQQPKPFHLPQKLARHKLQRVVMPTTSFETSPPRVQHAMLCCWLELQTSRDLLSVASFRADAVVACNLLSSLHLRGKRERNQQVFPTADNLRRFLHREECRGMMLGCCCCWYACWREA